MKRAKRLTRKTRLRPVNPKRKGHRFPMNVDEAYRAWIRERSCTVAGPYDPTRPERRDCDFYPWRKGMECAHLKTRGSGGADQGNIVPLCPAHHDEQEGKTAMFEKRYGVDLGAIAADLWGRYQRERGEAA